MKIYPNFWYNFILSRIYRVKFLKIDKISFFLFSKYLNNFSKSCFFTQYKHSTQDQEGDFRNRNRPKNSAIYVEIMNSILFKYHIHIPNEIPTPRSLIEQCGEFCLFCKYQYCIYMYKEKKTKQKKMFDFFLDPMGFVPTILRDRQCSQISKRLIV